MLRDPKEAGDLIKNQKAYEGPILRDPSTTLEVAYRLAVAGMVAATGMMLGTVKFFAVVKSAE